MRIRPAQNPESIRRHNLGLIVSAIHRNRGIPRNRLAQLTQLTKAAVSTMVQDLLDIGIVRTIGEGESSPRGGRKPIMLDIVPDFAVAVGVDIRRECISAVLFDLNAQLLAKESRIVRDRDSKEAILELVRQCIDGVLQRKPDGARLLGIGLGVPGPLDLLRGRVLDPPDFGDFRNIDLVAWIEANFKTFVFLSLGSAAGAMGEYCFRRDRGEVFNDIVFIEIDLGIGLGMIVNGSVIHGNTRHAAGEIGHMVIQVDGRSCSCGRRGCLYQYASGMAVLREIERDTISGYQKNIDAPDVSFPGVQNYGERLIRVVEAALSGDEKYQRLIRDAARYLCIAVGSIVNILSPSLLVIGSSIEGMASLYLDHMIESTDGIGNTGGGLRRNLQLSSYGLLSIAAGAAHVVLENFFQDPKKYIPV
jgi:predicted NBD/HSP70 family sugar kinase